MPEILNTIWTTEQIALTGLLALSALILAFARPRATEPADNETKPPSPWPTRIVLITIILVGIFLIARSPDPVGVRPDAWSEANVVVAGRNYAFLGLTSHYGVAQHQVATPANPSDPFFLYNRYPVLPSWINGVWNAVGVTQRWAQRMLPTFCSLLALWLWFSLFRRVTRDAAVATTATVAMGLSYGFLAYADHLHFHAYAHLTSVAAVYAFVLAMSPDCRSRAQMFILCAALMLLTALLTWEYHLWLVLFIALYAVLFRTPVKRGWLVLLILPLLVGVGFQVVQRRLAFANVDVASAYTDAPSSETTGFLYDIYRRTIGFEEEGDTPAGLTLAGYPEHLLLRYYKFYGVPMLGGLALLLGLLAYGRKPPWRIRAWSPTQRLLVILLIAGGGWWVVMMQHTSVHPHVMRQGLAGYALLLGAACVYSTRFALNRNSPLLPRLAAIIPIVALAYPQFEGLITDLRIHFQGRYTADSRDDYVLDARERGDAGFAESRILSQLAPYIPEGAVILTNHNRLPNMRIWTHRSVYSGRLAPSLHNNEHSRLVIELSFSHLRDLYADQLPPLYDVYRIKAPTLEQAFHGDALFRLMLTGNAAANDERTWRTAERALAQAWQTGQSSNTFCPIVGIEPQRGMIVFNLAPAVPLLRAQWADQKYPTLREFGLAR